MTDEQKNPLYYLDPNSGSAPQPGGSPGFVEETDETPEVVLEHVEAIKAEQKAREERENLEADEPEEQEVPGHPVSLVEDDDDKTDENEDGDKVDEGQKVDENVDQPVVPTPADVAPADVVFTSQSEGLDEDKATESTESTETEPVEAVEAPVEAYDPSKYNAAEVLTYIEEHPEEREAIIAAEAEGRKRKAVLSA